MKNNSITQAKTIHVNGLEFVHFAGYTFVSKEGLVYNSKRHSISSGNIDGQGYHSCTLTENGNQKTYKVHRMVAITFLPNPENKPEVNHLDGDKHNNHVDNLEWVTAKENTAHAWASGLKPNTITEEMRCEIGDEYLNTDISTKDLAKKYGVSKNSVLRYAKARCEQLNVPFIPRNQITEDERQQVYELYEAGYTKTEVAKRVSLCLPTVRKIVKEIEEAHGREPDWVTESPRCYNDKHRRRYIEENRELVHEYVRLHNSEGLSYQKIADKYGLEFYDIRNKITQYKSYCEKLNIVDEVVA